MNKLQLFKLFQEFKKKRSDALRNSIVEALYQDIFDIAKEQAPKLPENYEISDLFNAGVITLMEDIAKINAENSGEMQQEILNIIENAVQQELMLAIGSPAQTFIDHEEALKLKFEYQKKIDKLNKGEVDEKKKGQQKPE